MPRRKQDALIPFEITLLGAALDANTPAHHGLYGYQLAKDAVDNRGLLLVGHGTVYKALGRLESMGLLDGRWEDAADAERERRPRRRLYRITSPGESAFRSTLGSPSVEGFARHMALRPG